MDQAGGRHQRVLQVRQGERRTFATRQDFIRVERKGSEESRKLIKASKGEYQGLFSLLFRTMGYDSGKHVEIVLFLRRRLKEA